MEWLADRHLINHIPESLGTQLTETYQPVLMENVSRVRALKELEDELQDHFFPMWREFSGMQRVTNLNLQVVKDAIRCIIVTTPECLGIS